MWGDILTWVTNLAVVFGVIIAYRTLRADQQDHRERDRHRRLVLVAALLLGREQIRETAALDLARFRPETLDAAPPYGQHPAVVQARTDWGVQKEVGYRRSFAWTPLPSVAIDQVLREAWFLDLTRGEVRDLSQLSAVILRVNARITAKNALLPALVQIPASRPEHLSLTYAPNEWAAMVVDQLNRSIENDVREIKRICSEFGSAS